MDLSGLSLLMISWHPVVLFFPVGRASFIGLASCAVAPHLGKTPLGSVLDWCHLGILNFSTGGSTFSLCGGPTLDVASPVYII